MNNYNNVKYFDHQGSHWAPHLIHRSIWEKVGGFSVDFDPGFASDVDLNMKLWKAGVRIFKGINKFRVYHFGSMTTRKKTAVKRNKGNRMFLIKWGITSEMFIKFYLNSNTLYEAPLKDEPVKNIKFFVEYILCKVKLFLLKIFYFKL